MSENAVVQTLHNLSKPLPVVDVSFPGSIEYLGGWVAEVSIASNMGETFRSCLNTERCARNFINCLSMWFHLDPSLMLFSRQGHTQGFSN